MKLGPIEGTEEEIRNFTENHGLDVEKLFQFQAPEQKLPTRWIVIPAIVPAVIVAVLLSVPLAPATHFLVFLAGCGGLVWLAISVNIKWGGWPSAISGGGILLILLMAAGYIGPQEALDAVKGLGG